MQFRPCGSLELIGLTDRYAGGAPRGFGRSPCRPAGPALVRAAEPLGIILDLAPRPVVPVAVMVTEALRSPRLPLRQ